MAKQLGGFLNCVVTVPGTGRLDFASELGSSQIVFFFSISG
jgi:hypothetical protein